MRSAATNVKNALEENLELPAYSICTLVTRPDEYKKMCDNFRDHGFSFDDNEYLYIDNSSDNIMDAFSACNLFLQRARAPYIVICHQDVLLLKDGRGDLDRLIAEVSALDPLWALVGNAGVRSNRTLSIRISDPHGENRSLGGPFPARVVSLDENFIVVRKSANLALSRDLAGFHFYGADMCIIADILGMSSYVIDFHLRHKSGGLLDVNYYRSKAAFRRKYQRAFRSRWIPLVTMNAIYLTSYPMIELVARATRRAWQAVRAIR